VIFHWLKWSLSFETTIGDPVSVAPIRDAGVLHLSFEARPLVSAARATEQQSQVQ
jgi:hypothetical protein